MAVEDMKDEIDKLKKKLEQTDALLDLANETEIHYEGLLASIGHVLELKITPEEKLQKINKWLHQEKFWNKMMEIGHKEVEIIQEIECDMAIAKGKDK